MALEQVSTQIPAPVAGIAQFQIVPFFLLGTQFSAQWLPSVPIGIAVALPLPHLSIHNERWQVTGFSVSAGMTLGSACPGVGGKLGKCTAYVHSGSAFPGAVPVGDQLAQGHILSTLPVSFDSAFSLDLFDPAVDPLPPGGSGQTADTTNPYLSLSKNVNFPVPLVLIGETEVVVSLWLMPCLWTQNGNPTGSSFDAALSIFDAHATVFLSQG
jgi:hypothetical protein